MQSPRGPALPYSTVAGVVPCATGWLVASAKLHGATFVAEDPRVIATFVEVLDERPTFEVIALDAPIGSGDGEKSGERTCDREARILLDRRKPRVQLVGDQALTGGGAKGVVDRLDGITTALAARHREITAEMAPFRQRTVYEVLPELTFFQLNGDSPVRQSKRSKAGLRARRSLLEGKIPGVERILDVEIAGIAPTLLLDAAACLWSARRIAARSATRIPEESEWDDEGLRVEIVR